VRRLLAAQADFPGRWSTLDAGTLPIFLGIFDEVCGVGKSFLEVGSGHGLTCLLFALLGAQTVHGVELVPAAVEVAEELRCRVAPALPVVFRQGDLAQGLPHQDASFDVVLAVEVLSHVVADLAAVLRELVRVVVPGGLLYLCDGNNARSFARRRQNYAIWARFDQGPPTRGDETVHSHRVVTPYVETRRAIALAAVPSLSREEAQTIAAQTFRCGAVEVAAAAQRYAATGIWPTSPFRRRECPIEPMHRAYIEQLLDPLAIRRHLRSAGCDAIVCGPRRPLPWAPVWTAVPWLTFLVTNGFKIVARKRRR
jgi:SAM-dependent methyltransferase